MTQQETSERYHIPVSVLQAYERWGLCTTAAQAHGARQYDDEDLARLSTVMTLREICFTAEETEIYMRLLLEHPERRQKRLRMMEEKRNQTLDEIHFRERQLQRLDYLRRAIEEEG